MASAATPKPIYVVAGGEPFLKRQAVRDVLKRLGVAGSGEDPMGLTRFEASAPLSEVLDELRTIPLLASHRVVLVDDADEFISAHRAMLERYVEAPSPSGTLVLVCKSFPSNTRLNRMARAAGEVILCEPLKGPAVQAWITRQAEQVYGKRMDSSAATLLRRLVEDDLGTLDSEIAKLSVYVGERPAINAQDVEALVGFNREQRVFGIADALIRGDGPEGLALWEQVWATDRAAPGRAIAGLAWGLRRYLEAKYAVDAGQNCEALARQMWTTGTELRRRLLGLDVTRLEQLYTALLEADVDVKSGLGDVHAALEKLICQATG